MRLDLTKSNRINQLGIGRVDTYTYNRGSGEGRGIITRDGDNAKTIQDFVNVKRRREKKHDVWY